jgi:hypothetical protein
MAGTQKSLDEFNKNYEAQNEEDKDAVASGEYEDRETLRADRDVVYSGYYLESSQDGIEGKYGTNTAVRLTSPEGTKLTLWVNGYEEEHFNAFMAKLEKKGVSLPVKIDFLRTQEEAKTSGNAYNRLRIMEVASGEDVQMELESL